MIEFENLSNVRLLGHFLNEQNPRYNVTLHVHREWKAKVEKTLRKLNSKKWLILVKVISIFSKLAIFLILFSSTGVVSLVSLVPEISAHPVHKQKSCNAIEIGNISQKQRE